MTEKIDLPQQLHSLGLVKRTWPETLAAIKAALPPADLEKFTRAHKNFVAYRSETTLSRFYGTVFSLGIQALVNGYRYGRLLQVLEDLLPALTPGMKVLDVGAGGGYIATLAMRHRSPAAYYVQDNCAAVRDELTAQGFTVLPHPAPATAPIQGGFDRILCVDSVGELNGDDDGQLARPGGVPEAELPEQMEERYGFAQKLEAWKPFLARGGRILLWEPFNFPDAYRAVGSYLGRKGWNAEVANPAASRYHLSLSAENPGPAEQAP